MQVQEDVIGLMKYGSVHYEHLHGDKEGLSSVRVNDQYRIEFQEEVEEGHTVATMIANNLIPANAVHPGEILRDEIEYRGISQRDLARRIDVSPTIQKAKKDSAFQRRLLSIEKKLANPLLL